MQNFVLVAPVPDAAISPSTMSMSDPLATFVTELRVGIVESLDDVVYNTGDNFDDSCDLLR